MIGQMLGQLGGELFDGRAVQEALRRSAIAQFHQQAIRMQDQPVPFMSLDDRKRLWGACKLLYEKHPEKYGISFHETGVKFFERKNGLIIHSTIGYKRP